MLTRTENQHLVFQCVEYSAVCRFGKRELELPLGMRIQYPAFCRLAPPVGLGGSDTDSYCPGTGATAILASCLRSLGKGVGVNYNQTVKAIHTNFNDRRAVALLARLEKYTQELTLLFGQVVRLTEEFNRRWSAE